MIGIDIQPDKMEGSRVKLHLCDEGMMLAAIAHIAAAIINGESKNTSTRNTSINKNSKTSPVPIVHSGPT